MCRGPGRSTLLRMDVSITAFGELAVLGAGARVDPAGRKPRLLLALLVSRANAVVRVSELLDALWDGGPPPSAHKNLQVYVSKLRRVFGERLGYVHGGYRLRLEPERCDLLLFEQSALAGRARARAGDARGALDAFGRAVALWSGRPLEEFDGVPSVSSAVERLEELFLSALEEWAELELDRGGHRAVLDRMQDHVGPHGLRERLAAAWMRALAAAGRANEALAYFESVRRKLSRELGVPPGPALVRLHGGLLRSPAAMAGAPGPGNQLPRGVPDFVGRSEQVHRAAAYLGTGAGGALVVSGPVGIGKSVFALHVAHLVSAAYPDGAVFVEAGGRPAEAVLRTALETVGLEGAGSEARMRARWRAWIAGRRVLLVLDDAAGDEVVGALLPGSGAGALIVTSRFRLSGLEAVERADLDPLTEAESLDLLGRIVGPGRVLADPAAARRIAGLCEGLPLAVRATGARLDALRHIRPADYAERLRDAACLLDEMHAGGLSLRERYRAFWRDLPQPSRRAYRRLAALAAASPPGPLELDLAVLEALRESNLLLAPQAEVSAHTVLFGISRFAGEFAREIPSDDGGLPRGSADDVA